MSCKYWRYLVIITVFVCLANNGQGSPSITVTNHFRFPVNQTVRVAPETGWLDKLAQGKPGIFQHAQARQAVQVDGNGCWIQVDMAPGESAAWTYTESEQSNVPSINPEVTQTFSSGLPQSVRINDDTTVRLFDLALVEITDDFKQFKNKPELKRTALLEALTAPASRPAAFELEKQENGPLVSTLVYRGTIQKGNTYRVNVTYRISPPSSVDVQVDLQALTNKYEEGYLALAKFLPAEENEKASIRWKGEIQDLPWKGQSAERDARTHHWGRDVNWLCLSGDGGIDGLMADFTPGMTRLINGSYRPVNDFVVNELVLGTEAGWYMISEISRSNYLKAYVKQYYVIPQEDEVQTLRLRCVRLGDPAVRRFDQDFIAWAGYRQTQTHQDRVDVNLGVSHVEFGTSYFPHSTLGENFQYWKTRDLVGERWWPYHRSAWQASKADIRRDMMIANAMGMKWLRIHHLDMPGDFKADTAMFKNEPWLMDYLDYMAETARETGLYLYLDLAVSPEFAGAIVRKHGDIARYYEIQNEILLRGIDTELLPYWKTLREQIKQRADTKVVLTGGPLFLGLYPKLDDLAMDLDGVGHHCYVDRREVPEAFADYALAIGGYASRQNKIPINSEINWRFITRETLDQQAQHFGEIFESFLSQQSVPMVGQFQFQETFCVPPVSRGALRHYEVLHVDRTPKPQAGVYRRLIQKYTSPQEPVNNLEVTYGKEQIAPGQTLTVPVTFKNIGRGTIRVKTECILPEGLSLKGKSRSTFSLKPQETVTLDRRLAAAKTIRPGFYHLFEKITLGDRLFFGWGILPYTHQPQLALDEPVLENVKYESSIDSLRAFDLSKVKAVVFGSEAPAREVDWTLYVYESLRSATGADIQRYSDTDPQALELLKSGHAVLVGTMKSNRLIAQTSDALRANLAVTSKDAGIVRVVDNPFHSGSRILLVTGDSEEAVERAASDFLLRYWKNAKDAITFRVGMHSETAQTKEDETDTEEVLEIVIPDKATVGEKIRLRVVRTTEPPGPAAGKPLWAYVDGEWISLGKTSGTGEVFYTFEKAGRYRVRVDKNRQTTTTLVVDESKSIGDSR